MNKKYNLAFTAGGTGGHIYPAVAIIQEAEEANSFIIGEENREGAKISVKYKIPFTSIPFSSKNPYIVAKAFFIARKELKKIQPRSLISTGGAITVPVVIAAYTLKIPIIIMEQNVLPGRANKYLQYFAKYICLSFKESEKYFNKRKTILTGNPIRKSFPETDSYHLLKQEINNNYPIILAFGGSQGANTINQLLSKSYQKIIEGPYILIHLTGEAYFKKEYKNKKYILMENQKKENKIFVFPSFEKMDYLYEKADLIICRAGATTIAEILEFNKKAVLIPYPFAKDDHQKLNAEAFARKSLGIIIEEKEIDYNLIKNSIKILLKANADINPSGEKTENAREKIFKIIQT
jgi:UDP-N-acetylglucosamine--N-acetylmuramyl-(pentapeptide) pyrophosphoryl-undecaprenol N-acetylglucosamine transferase